MFKAVKILENDDFALRLDVADLTPADYACLAVLLSHFSSKLQRDSTIETLNQMAAIANDNHAIYYRWQGFMANGKYPPDMKKIVIKDTLSAMPRHIKDSTQKILFSRIFGNKQPVVFSSSSVVAAGRLK